MKNAEFALSEIERHFKYEYENGGAALLKRPMSYDEFIALSADKRKYYGNYEQYHEIISVNNPGNTVKEVNEYGENIDVVRHGRYGYPLMHNHAYIELVYVYSGECVHFVENMDFKMEEGDVCILAPDAMHAISAESDDAVIINVMMSKKMFDLSFLRILKSGQTVSEFLEHVLYNKKVSPYLMFPTGRDEWMHEMALKLYRERARKDYLFNESATLFVKLIFIHLIRNYEMMAIVSNPLDNTQESNIVALMAYINVNYSRVTLKETAQFFGYNETYLGQIIQKYTNKKFSTLVNELQMKNGKRLLTESNLSITEISCEIGCYDSSHFTRKFKKMYGMTPKEYRMEYNLSLRQQ